MPPDDPTVITRGSRNEPRVHGTSGVGWAGGHGTSPSSDKMLLMMMMLLLLGSASQASKTTREVAEEEALEAMVSLFLIWRSISLKLLKKTKA